MSAHKFYTVTKEGVKRDRQSCPRCGDGVFLAKHKDRQSCGKCGYTEFMKKKK
ncbi:MAG: 30S ribosomal protein S27ae [Halobacteriota archaeon]|nr:30S ribosomal protein S27ae [Halobacteriota archaeon]